MGRRRSTKTRSLPPNLYEQRGYFTWRDPRSGKTFGLGRDRRSAINQAIEANHEVAGTRGKRSLVDRLTAGPDNSVSAWCDRYQEIVAERDVEQSTRDLVAQRLKRVRAEWGDRRIDSVTTRDVADFLGTWEQAGKKRSAQAVRSLLLDLFREAIAKGWVQTNPVAPTRAARVEVKRSRLTLEDFLAIHDVAVKEYAPWLARALELALVTGQRREDVAAMGPRSVRDNKLWIEQGKTGAKVCIPLALRLQVVNWSVGEVIARCKDKVLSPYFLHHSAFAGRAKPGDKIRLQTITNWFAEARDKTGRNWPDGMEPPSFHEIRSLSARLYAEQGTDAQSLLGHKSPDMTAVYRDARGAEWVEVRLG
ncbi:MAG TPA: phage integrase Arm DNA-binding domain-containing protein [Azospirillum sp.]